LSVKKDVLDYEGSKKLPWPYYTPTVEFADFTSLDKLPKVSLISDLKYGGNDKTGTITVTLKNPSEAIAFFIFMDVLDPDTMKPILPIYWDDNYVSLLPGEERTFSASYRKSDFNAGQPVVEFSGWNIQRFMPAMKMQSF
jgi:exo-1,4-beta-D-glucosaminidase